MNHLTRKLAMFACACSLSSVAMASAVGPVVTSSARQPLLQQALGAPVLGKDRSNSRLAKFDATLHRLYQQSIRGGATTTTAAMKKVTPQARLRSDVPRATPSVLVNITVKGDPAAVKAQLAKLDLRNSSVFSNLISGWLPVDHLADAAALGGVHFMRASLAHTHTGSVVTQGDRIERSDLVRASALVPGLLGTGVTVGVLSDSFNCLDGYTTDITTGDLPADVNLIEEDGGTEGTPTTCPADAGGTDEGRAMAQVIYDIAPGSKLAFYTAFNGEADFANGILALAKAGAKVITDDVGYFDEPVFQDGIVAQAIDQVKAKGVAYFSSAGNNAQQSWEGPWIGSDAVGADGSGNAGEKLMTFKGSDGSTSTFLPIQYYPDHYVLTAILEWDQPYVTGAPGSGGTSSALNICATDENGVVLSQEDPNTHEMLQVCSGPAAVSADSVSIVQYQTPGTDFGGLAVSLADGTPAPKNLKIFFDDNGFGTQAVDPFATYSGTIQGHPGAAGAAAIGATYWRHTPVCSATRYPKYELEAFSSSGGTPILFDAKGVALEHQELRQKPNFVAPDGGATTFFGNDTGDTVIGGTDPSCDIPPHSFLFRGTSEAAPHAAGVAALLQQAVPGITPDQIYSALASSAIDMTANGVDFDSGYGFIQADAALALIAHPQITLTPATLTFNQVRQTESGFTAPQTLTVSSTGNVPLLVNSISTTGEFQQTNNCPASLAVGASCTITVTMATTLDTLSKTGSVLIASNSPASPNSAALNGTITSSGGSMPFWLLLPGLAAFAARRRKQR